MIPVIEKKAGFKFERIAAPQPADIARASASSAAESIKGVSDRSACFIWGAFMNNPLELIFISV